MDADIPLEMVKKLCLQLGIAPSFPVLYLP